MARPMLLYDADCGFCTRSARWAALRLVLDVHAIQSVDLTRLGVDPGRARRELPFVAADGAVSYGHLAVAGALGTGRLPGRVAGRLLGAAVLSRPGAAVYGWVARHRQELPGGTASCDLPHQAR